MLAAKGYRRHVIRQLEFNLLIPPPCQLRRIRAKYSKLWQSKLVAVCRHRGAVSAREGSHIFAGGYAAGYYSYAMGRSTALLAATSDAFSHFEEGISTAKPDSRSTTF